MSSTLFERVVDFLKQRFDAVPTTPTFFTLLTLGGVPEFVAEQAVDSLRSRWEIQRRREREQKRLVRA